MPKQNFSASTSTDNHPYYHRIVLVCPKCTVNFSNYLYFLQHIFKCFKGEKSIEIIKTEFNKILTVKTEKEIEAFLEETEIDHFVNLIKTEYAKNNNLKGIHKTSTTYHCNFKTNNEHMCPFFKYIVFYSSKHVFRVKQHFKHKHTIDTNKLRVNKIDRNNIIQYLKNGKKPEIIIAEKSKFSSPKARVALTSNYVRTLYNNQIIRKYGHIDRDGFKTLVSELSSDNSIINYVLNMPGLLIRDLVYDINKFLYCFQFSQQKIDMIQKLIKLYLWTPLTIPININTI